MSNNSVIVRDQSTIDVGHLKLLAIFHFVSVGFAVLGLLFLYGHYTILHTFLSNPKFFENSKSGPPPAEFLEIMKWFYVVFGIWFCCSGVANLVSGFFIRARKNRMFSLIVAGWNCLHMPLGTILGVFTFIVLLRESVKDLYKT